MTQTMSLTPAEESLEEMAARARQGAIPRHIAIIMDGNGRWASRQGLPRFVGHQAGSASVREAVQACRALGVEVLTLYAFSVENWRRPKDEVQTLMMLIEAVIHREIEDLHAAGVRLGVLGRLHELPQSLQDELRRDIERTSNNTGLLLNLAINYGGRAEIIDAVRSLGERIQAGQLAPQEVDEEMLAHALYTRTLPDPDLLIRTAGEMRISNFLLWQVAYAELWVTEDPWPDFKERHLIESVLDYQRRQRKFGAVP